MSITIGSWAIPTIVTVALYVAAIVAIPAPRSNGTFIPDIGGALVAVLSLATATILSLIAWLVWALV